MVSIRNQDWVIKIDYADGTGDGHVVWRLGQGGNFRINSADPIPVVLAPARRALYQQHDAWCCSTTGTPATARTRRAHSRGQELILNEKTRRATLVVNADLGNYASAMGSAQMLPNGNLDFDSGFAEQTIEVRPDGGKTYVLKMNMSGNPVSLLHLLHRLRQPRGHLLALGTDPPRLARRLAIMERRAEIRQVHLTRSQEIRQVHLANRAGRETRVAR